MNLPRPPFPTNNNVDMSVDLDDETDDRRRIAAEFWCLHQTRGDWFRSVIKIAGTVRFSFANLQDAALFKLANC